MKPFLVSVFLIVSLSTSAQMAIGVKGFKYYVSEASPPQLGNTICGSLVLSVPVTDNHLVVGRGDVIYINHKIRFPEIPSYVVEVSGNDYTLYPGVLEQQKFAEFQIAIGADLNFLNFEKFKAYLGADVFAGSYDSDYESNNVLYIKDETASGGILGYRIRVGSSFRVTHWLEPFIEAAYYGKRYYGITDLHAMDLGLGLKFWLNDD